MLSAKTLAAPTAVSLALVAGIDFQQPFLPPFVSALLHDGEAGGAPALPAFTEPCN